MKCTRFLKKITNDDYTKVLGILTMLFYMCVFFWYFYSGGVAYILFQSLFGKVNRAFLKLKLTTEENTSHPILNFGKAVPYFNFQNKSLL